MANNDEKIKELLKAVEDKKAKMGRKPRASWETNGVIEGVNINTITSIDKCVELASGLMMKSEFYHQACSILDVSATESNVVRYVNDALADIKLRTQMLKWDKENKKLMALEKKLKDLRSEDAKTKDELDDIVGKLGL